MRSSVVLSVLAALAAVCAAPAGPATALAAGPPAFGPAGSPIAPGVALVTAGTSCTANFVFTDAQGRVYLGQAGHCARIRLDPEPSMPTGCTFASHPVGTPVEIGSTGVVGRLAYVSFQAMQARAESDPNACRFNDFALVEVPSSAIGTVNPSVPFFGGPTGLNTTGTLFGDLVVGMGNSPTRQDLDALKPKQSVAAGSVEGGWANLVYSVSPGIPGDSGGPYLDADGRALGSLTALVLTPPPASNSLTDIAQALAYARASGIAGLALALGTEPFAGPLITQALTRPPGPGG